LSNHRASPDRCVIIGAGPAGLTAALEALKLGIPAIVYEKDDVVGGISRTVRYKEYRFDIGGHRFFTRVPEIQKIWEEILGPDLLTRPRLSRVYYNDRFFDYPIKPLNALRGLGPAESLRIIASYTWGQLFPSEEERNFEQWVSNRFGRRLYEIFFKSYTEKVWGMSCTEISADWAAQRIKNLDLATALKNALFGSRSRDDELVTSLIDHFQYPRLGPGMLWERCRELLATEGCPTFTGTEVVRVRHDAGRIVAITLRDRAGRESEQSGAHFVSTMPIRELLNCFDPAPPPEVLEAANRLRHRDFLMVALIVDRADVFPDNWIYVQSPRVRVGRIQNFKNWSPAMVPDPRTSSLGLEYFVQEGDELWSAADDELIDLGRRECEKLGLLRTSEVTDGFVMRVPKAYPVYDSDYSDAMNRVRDHVAGFPNLYLVGRNGQHRYNNQDHSMLTALYAVRNLAGASCDVWDVNIEPEYHEEVQGSPSERMDRLLPAPARDEVGEDLVRSVFARYDPVALGGALALVLGLGLFLATAILLLRGGDPVGPMLSLLGNYLLGYQVSWGGALLGMVEAALGGYVFGVVLAKIINAVISGHESVYRRNAELARSIDFAAGGVD